MVGSDELAMGGRIRLVGLAVVVITFDPQTLSAACISKLTPNSSSHLVRIVESKRETASINQSTTMNGTTTITTSTMETVGIVAFLKKYIPQECHSIRLLLLQITDHTVSFVYNIHNPTTNRYH